VNKKIHEEDEPRRRKNLEEARAKKIEARRRAKDEEKSSQLTIPSTRLNSFLRLFIL